MTRPQTPTGAPAPPARPSQEDRGGVWAYNARVGLILFFVYLALYAGFIAMSAFGKEVMAKPSLGGVNVAVLYGFLLIAAAFLLALLYMALCRPEPAAPAAGLTEAEVSDKALSEEGSA